MEIKLSEIYGVNKDMLGNQNVLVLGGKNSKKFGSFILPNLVEADRSYIVVDKKGVLNSGIIRSFKDYKIRTLDLMHPDRSLKYNPLHYIDIDRDTYFSSMDEERKAINSLNSVLEAMLNINAAPVTDEEEDFVFKEKLLLTILLLHTRDCMQENERLAKENGTKIGVTNPFLDLLYAIKSYGGGADGLYIMLYNSSLRPAAEALYQRFSEITNRKSDKNCYQIAEACLNAIRPFAKCRAINNKDEMDLKSIQDEKTCLFISYNGHEESCKYAGPVVATLLNQAMLVFARQTGKEHVQLIMDDFCNYNMGPEFANLLSILKIPNVSASIIARDIMDIIKAYPNTWQALAGNCSTTLFMGDASPLELYYLNQFGYNTGEALCMKENECMICSPYRPYMIDAKAPWRVRF